LIDLSPEGARARMQHGHIYPPEQARVALERFFQPENLTALRDLALRRTAQEVDQQLEELMRDTHRDLEVEDKVLVYIDETTQARTLIRHGWRLAQGLKAELLVAYMKRELGDSEERELARTLELAEDLNARVAVLDGEKASQALSSFVVLEGVDHVVLRNEKRGFFARLLKPSFIEEVVARSPGTDVHLVGV
jgi:two-component system, OmpR family, sensor histidine kinase KdpD